ncbi:MAG TPA: serine/threonine-protein kinase [Isosphaeraceae bacterium]|nr:serine/threonine-protein kinase [Isosphaeraceae bacterium]
MDELNRDLLVAVLALLTDAIPRSSLSAALSSWSKDRRRSLAHLFLREGILDEERLQALQCLAEAHLKGHHHDLSLCLQAWNAQDLTQEVMTEVGDAALCTTLGISLGGDTTLPVNRQAEPLGELPAPAGGSQSTGAPRFLPMRPHARGGLGQVWVARDCELQREVALKVIQPRFAERADQRARFVLEAEITGKLEHPGIVPVYSLGRNADGRPYYAMRFIRGESLQAAIQHFHQRSGGAAGGESTAAGSLWGIEFRQLLGRFLDVCDALDYAHSRGVLHRDLKPANIMLGRYGETLVVDWGLAKVIGTGDLLPATADGDFEPDLAGGTTSPAGETQPGISIGTPAYMSPEQARGALDELGPASDVYSLGATLYELLTGQVAFPGEKPRAVIDKVLAGDFPPPRAVLRSVPAPLEAICLKAMAFAPEQRYDSVRALARDLEHWLADEPVAAYPERRHERLGRWLRQHRTWTTAAVAAMAGLSLAATIGVVVVEGARRREAAARKEAETNFRMAQKAVDDYLTSVSQNTLLNEQDSVDIRSLRQELLEKGLEYYQRFVAQRTDDPRLRRELANAYTRVAEVTREIGTPRQALAVLRSARSIWEDIVAADPAAPEPRGRLADCLVTMSKLQTATDEHAAAVASLVRARELLEPLVARHPNVASYQASLAECYSDLGLIQGRLQSPEQGLEKLEQAKAILERLIRQDPGGPRYEQKLAETINDLGFIYFQRLDYPAALRSYQQVRDICQSLVERVTVGPKPVRLLDLLAISHYNIATIQHQQGQLEAALRSFQRSLEYRTALVDAHPSVTDFQELLGKNLGEIAYYQHQAHQEGQAFASVRRSIEVLEELVRRQSEQSRYRSDLGRSYNMLGYLYDEARENAAAIPAFERAIAEQERAVKASPAVVEYTVELRNHVENLGEQFVDLGRVADGLPYYRRGVEIRRELLRAHPGSRRYTMDLAEGLGKLGEIQRHDGDSAAAQQSLGVAGMVLEPAAAAAPADADLQSLLGVILTAEAVAQADLRGAGAALDRLRRAVTILEPIGSAPGADGRHRERLAEALWELARLVRAEHRPEEADRLDAERSALWASRPPEELADLALRQGSRAALIGYGKTPLSPPAQTVRQLDLDQAAANLRLAIDRGYSDLARLRAHPDSAALLARADVQSLVKGLEHPVQPAPTQPSKSQ